MIGAKAIAEVLKVNKSLIYLDLGSDCHWGDEWAICDKGAEFLAEALETNNTLTYLRLARRIVSPEWINFFIEALQTNYSLTTLILNR
ncbi:hypothetical protein A1C_04465 [Rickettsia akari str. Hartford]|uniref:Uncharacterized protein n=1 Tax=Rickettsia akari (strain Hartford) TaxID=293614 RepID=A8GP38_RICAH|nr:hypothetical protein [Rickettsia akari]ABV75163.1 hypothetical protein A1C_04465 [Rickettsia akari str. Hartford]